MILWFTRGERPKIEGGGVGFLALFLFWGRFRNARKFQIRVTLKSLRIWKRLSKERKQFSKPIGGYQLTQAKLAEMVTRITESQLLVYRLGRLKDEGKMTFQQVSLAKRNNCELARNVARISRGILGANGITEDYPIMRHMANIESVYTYEGTHEMHTLIIGQDVTGLAAYDS